MHSETSADWVANDVTDESTEVCRVPFYDLLRTLIVRFEL